MQQQPRVANTHETKRFLITASSVLTGILSKCGCGLENWYTPTAAQITPPAMVALVHILKVAATNKHTDDTHSR